MSRARIKNKKFKKNNKQELIQMIESKIYISELKEIATLYFIKEMTALDISFIVNKCDKCVYKDIKEIEKILE